MCILNTFIKKPFTVADWSGWHLPFLAIKTTVLVDYS
jgi:hypothetical protein